MNETTDLYLSYRHALGFLSDRAFYVVTIPAFHIIVSSLFCWFIHFAYRYHWFDKYKIRPAKEYPPEKLVLKAIKEFYRSKVISLAVHWFFLYHVYTALHEIPFNKPMDPWYIILAQIPVFILLEDMLFYWAHRLFHHPAIYKLIHKKHHQFRYTVGFAAEYAHPVEAVVANTLPSYAGPALLGAHPVTFLIWIFLRVWESTDAHSGFLLPWSPWNLFLSVQGGVDRHDFHHSRNVGSYGSFTKFWDWFCGTDTAFNDFIAKKQQLKATRAKAVRS
eukprot:m.9939 g.9939  ORF g.9939 m.9939 type:complete len:276 (-) comp7294_c0_seq1:75-902(-)